MQRVILIYFLFHEIVQIVMIDCFIQSSEETKEQLYWTGKMHAPVWQRTVRTLLDADDGKYWFPTIWK